MKILLIRLCQRFQVIASFKDLLTYGLNLLKKKQQQLNYEQIFLILKQFQRKMLKQAFLFKSLSC